MPFASFKKLFAQSIAAALPTLSLDTIEKLIITPPSEIDADFAFPCFQLAKELQKSPGAIAQDLSHQVTAPANMTIEAAGPYLNARIASNILAQTVMTAVATPDYGRSSTPLPTVLLEGRQPNTHKAFHIGHLRNAVLSEAMARVLEHRGHPLYRTSYMGDIGAHVAKWIRYYTNHYTGTLPTHDFTKWSGELYAAATTMVDENPECKDQIHAVQHALENGDEALLKIRKETRDLCIQDMKHIFKELDCRIDHDYYESDVEQIGIRMVKKLEADGIARYSEGAIIMDLAEQNLGVFLILKSNGTSLYSTKDIALAYRKSEDYKFDVSLYIVGAEQEHHFQQLFATLRIMGYPEADALHHLCYGLVTLPEGKMSSRK